MMAGQGGPAPRLLKRVGREEPERGTRLERLGRFVGRGVTRRPGTALLSVAFGICAVAVGWNAMTQQGNRHPAPLFARTVPPADPPRRPELAVAPIPAPRPDIFLASAPGPAEPSPTRSVSEAAARPIGTDPIGALIRASGSPKSDEARADAQKIAAAQKALLKLGYGPLRADGVFGTGTRQALERFERDRNLPVTGTLGSRTSRQLASLSGLDLD